MSMTRLLKLSALPLVFCLISQAQSVPPKTGSALTQKQAAEALAFHNKVRKEVAAPNLAWSTQLASYAQQWADHLAKSCQLEHRPSKDRTYGENLFFGEGSGSFTPLFATQTWYEEKPHYSGVPITLANIQAAGHYTQMIWTGTTNLGIGFARCKGNSGAVIMVANYDPPGNVIGQKP